MPRRILWVLAVLAILAAAMPAKADGPHAFRGRFLVRYQPIWCKRAPCAKGSYAIEAGGKRLGLVKRVDIDPETAPARRRFIATFDWGNEPLAIEGDARFPAGASVVVIRADRAIEGEWKP